MTNKDPEHDGVEWHWHAPNLSDGLGPSVENVMKRDDSVSLAVQMASDVLDMHDELQRLREENNELLEYRKKYIDLLDADIARDRHMMGDLLNLALRPGVLDTEAD